MSAENNRSYFNERIQDIISADLLKMGGLRIGSPNRAAQNPVEHIPTASPFGVQCGSRQMTPNQFLENLRQRKPEFMEHDGDVSQRMLKRAANEGASDNEVHERHQKQSRLSEPSTSQNVFPELSTSYVFYRCLFLFIAVFVVPYITSLFRQTE